MAATNHLSTSNATTEEQAINYLKERLHKADGMANEINILVKENRHLRMLLKNLLPASKDLLAWFNEVYPPQSFTGESGDPGAVRVAAIRRAAELAIAEAENK